LGSTVSSDSLGRSGAFSDGLYPWTIPAAPWARGLVRASSSHWEFLPVEAGLVANSGFAYGRNDGAVWSGRGLTAVAMGGGAARWGRLSVMIEPVGFVAQNASFQTVFNPTRDATTPDNIDQPQRFGSGAYARIDPGESEVRLVMGDVAAGASTRVQVWGPAIENPLILGNNAAGIPRLFVASQHPLALGPLLIHGQVEWGRLNGSGYEDAQLPARMLTGAVGSVGFKAIPGLEVGGIRLFHVPLPADGASAFLKVFEGILKSSLANPNNPTGNDLDNQLASAFFRWAPPAARVELYGEFGREDHSWNLRDFLMEPDHNSGYMIGLARAFGDSATPTVFRAEHLNTRISSLQVASAQERWYLHTRLRQGHTERGQVLGSPGGPGGGGTTVAIEHYEPNGRTAIRWDRTMFAERRAADGLPEPDDADVLHSLTVDRLRMSHRGDLGFSVSLMKDFNRHFGGDAFNLNAAMTYRAYLSRR
jgi:hypothetical protein